ncbi:MAG: single-stranded DNA-binding protein [Deltaproteobacteria bacterium]|nr:MAG: single-stranded DNA-binding protein [Deltaproteobacteria bacterium]
MSSLNKVMLIGNLGRDPEISYTQGGTAVCRFNIATSERWTDRQTGERKEQTEWHRVVTFNRTAENCGNYLSKGRSVYVEGRLQTSSYEKDGITRYSTDIIANTVKFLGGRGDGGGYGGGQGGGYNQGPPQQSGGYGGQQGGYQQQGGGYTPPPPPAQPAAPQQPADNSFGGNYPDGPPMGPPEDDIPF